MNYHFEAIETEYKGVLFRSRLEARWAAFFDYLGFVWYYEPEGFPGWIPDFMILPDLLVEVKPISEFNANIDFIKWDENVMLCGISPFINDFGQIFLGWDFEGDKWMLKKDKKFGLSLHNKSWKDKINKCHEKSFCMDIEILNEWNKANNKTRFMTKTQNANNNIPF